MGAALRFKQTLVPRQQGEQARLKVVRGPDAGAVYVLQGNRATIGRGDENDVVITDLKASRRHVELVMTGSGWSAKDLGSANGILCNGQATREGVLHTKDTLGLGDTLFEFMTQEAPTVMLKSPAPNERQIKAEQDGLAVQRAKVVAMSQFGGLAKNKPKVDGLKIVQPVSTTPPAQKKPIEPKTLILAVVVIGAALFMFDSPVVNKMKRKHVKQTKQEEMTPDVEDDSGQIEKAAEILYLDGFREYNQGNFLRAKNQFETVLQMMPTHAMAKRYLENSNKAIDDQVREQLYSARRAECSGKLKEARGRYEHVLRLLFRDRSNPAYLQAKDHLQNLDDKKTLEECKG